MEGKVEFLVQRWNAQILGGIPVAKATFWPLTDAEVRKRGQQTGLDTLVVHAVNDECQVSGVNLGAAANALNTPPGEYARKCETQRN